MRKAQTSIRSRNREWPPAARASMPQTAVFTVTANRCVLNISRTISNVSGEAVAARRAIIFSSGLCFLERCAWVRIWRISVRVLNGNRRALSLPAEAEAVPVQARQLRRRRRFKPGRRPLRLVRLLRLAVARRLRQSRQRLLRRRLPRLKAGLRLLAAQLKPVRPARLQLRGQYGRKDCRPCIPRRGIMCISIRRA